MSAGYTVRPCPTPRKGSLLAQYATHTTVGLVNCRRWACPTCGPRNARKLRSRLELTHANRLITLTLQPNPNESRTDSTRRIRLCWTKLRKRLNRQFTPRGIHYVAIIEYTQKGTAHLHIWADSPFISQRALSRAWYAVSGARIVDIRRIRAAAPTARYLTAYLTKDMQMPPRLRKWSASRAFLPQLPPREFPPDELVPTWAFSPRAPWDILRDAQNQGAALAELTEDSVLIIWPVRPIPPPSAEGEPP